MTQWYRNRYFHEKNVYTTNIPPGKNILFPTSAPQLYVSANLHLYNYIPEENGVVIALNLSPFSAEQFLLFLCNGYQMIQIKSYHTIQMAINS